MDERLKESISALMDDESNELELQRILSHADEQEVQDLWGRYHEVRQVLGQSEEDIAFDIDVSAGVASAIRDEAISADVSSTQATAFVSESEAQDGDQKVVAIGRDNQESTDNRFGGRTWLAVAASVAFALVFTLNSVNEQPGTNVQQVASNVASDSSLLKVAAEEQPRMVVEMTDEQARHFGQYLLRHAEHSVRGTQSGFMPLARVASVNSVGI